MPAVYGCWGLAVMDVSKDPTHHIQQMAQHMPHCDFHRVWHSTGTLICDMIQDHSNQSNRSTEYPLLQIELNIFFFCHIHQRDYNIGKMADWDTQVNKAVPE